MDSSEFEELIAKQRSLVEAIQNGEEALFPELWETVKRYITRQAKDYYWACHDKCPLVELDELVSIAYLAMPAAVESYDLSQKRLFVRWLLYYCRKEWRKLYGFDSKDPIHTAMSLETPLGDSDDDYVLEDTVFDRTAMTPEELLEQTDSRAWIKGALDELLKKIPSDTESILRASYLLGRKNSVLCEETGLDYDAIHRLKQRGLLQLRSKIRHTTLGHKIRDYYRGTVSVHHVGAKTFAATHTSEQERYLLDLEQAEDRAMRTMPYYGLEPDEVIALQAYRDKYFPLAYAYASKAE